MIAFPATRASPHESPPRDAAVRAWIARRLAQAPPRAPSLVITVWGDAIAPHGGAAMLPGLIALLTPFGINERLVRTSVFRLGRQGWLTAKAVGRRSLYRLTAEGARRFHQAYARIYAAGETRWNDGWELVMAGDVAPHERRRLRDELSWEGFGVIAPAVYARPARDAATIARIAVALGLGDRLLAVCARDDPAFGVQPLRSAVVHAWDLDGIAAAYRAFLRRYGGVVDRFRRRAQDDLHPEQCFVVRTLLIHEYRRMLLRDPQLPSALLPLDWPGGAAAALCRDLYRLTQRAAERHLMRTLQGARGPLPAANAEFYARFGGLR